MRKEITKGQYTAKIDANNFVMLVHNDGSQHGRVVNYPAPKTYANRKTAERGAKAMLAKV
jgi:hypothetical protein